MADPPITAVIPTYRRPDSLRSAIESVLSQDYPDLTVAVFDNASGDETEKVVRELAARDHRVHYHCQPRNLGGCANFQAGMNSVDTAYFSFLSDDDILLPGFYRHAIARLQAEPRAKFFCGQTVSFDPDSGSHHLSPMEGWRNGLHEGVQSTARMVRRLFTWTASLFATDIREKAGPLEKVEMNDLLFLGKAAAQFPFVVSLVPCAVFRAWKGNASHTMSVEQIGQAYRSIAERLTGLSAIPSQEGKRIEAILEEKLQATLRSRFRSSFLAGDWESFDRTVALLSEKGELNLGKKLRICLANRRRSNPRLLRLYQSFLKDLSDWKRSRRCGPPLSSIEDVVRTYSGGFHDP